MKSMLYLAPLHGLTDVTFRNVYFSHYKGIDRAIAPFVSITPGDKITPVKVRELSPLINDTQVVIPQLLGNEAEGFLMLSRFLYEEYGYREINWNLGCPVPNIVKKQRGSGLLPFPEKIDRFLDKILGNFNGQLSIKTRLGYSDSQEFREIANVLNKYPLKSVSIHPRLGVQMYDGKILYNEFLELLPLLNHSVKYSGDLWNLEELGKVKRLYPKINDFMLGRGVLYNPLLPELITNETDQLCENSMERFAHFYYDLEGEIRSKRRLWMDKMKEYWKYFYRICNLNPEQLVKLQKCTNENDWNIMIKHFLTRRERVCI